MSAGEPLHETGLSVSDDVPRSTLEHDPELGAPENVATVREVLELFAGYLEGRLEELVGSAEPEWCVDVAERYLFAEGEGPQLGALGEDETRLLLWAVARARESLP